jgi:hypothetical protein
MTELGIQGGCFCGTIRYRATSPPRISTICHCADCRKASGAASVAWVTFPAEGFAFVEGEPSRYRSSPPVVRTFCGRCGTPLTYRSDERKHEIDVTTASLDEPEAFPPTKHVFPEQKLSWVEVAPLPVPVGDPAPVDLRPRFQQWGLGTRRQGDRPTCSVFTVVGALEYAVASRQRQGTRLSVEFLNWAAHAAAARTADGGFFSELWAGYTTYGICPEEALPYQERYEAALQPEAGALDAARRLQSLGLRLHWIKEWNPETGLTDAEFDAIRQALACEWPVCGGFRWPRQARWEDGVLQFCPPEEVYDGHSVLLVGYQDDPRQPGGGVFLIRNSSGDGRDGALPYAYVRAYMNDAAWVDLATS